MPVERKIGQDVVDQYYAVYKSKESWKQTITQEEGEWISNCDECYEGELIREYVVDMEFIALIKWKNRKCKSSRELRGNV